MSKRRQYLRCRPTIADMAKAFGAVDAMLAKLAEGWIHAVQGNPVFFNRADETWYDIPAALGGWVAPWERISAQYDLGLDMVPISRMVTKLHHGAPITREEVDRCADIVVTCKRHYRGMDVFAVVNTQLIANQAQLMGLAE